MPKKRDTRSNSFSNSSPMKSNKKNKIRKKRRQTLMLGEEATFEQHQSFKENAELCELVKAEACLYDTNHEKYGCKVAMNEAWWKIAAMSKHTVRFCKERFHNLRSAYGRSIDAYKTSYGPNRVKRYYLHKQLDFLDPFLIKETTETSTLTNGNGTLKASKTQMEKTMKKTNIIEIFSDSNESTPASELNVTDLEVEDRKNDPDKYFEVRSAAPTETATNRQLTGSILHEYQNERIRSRSISITAETDIASNNDVTQNIATLEDQKFLNCILYVMQDMNKRQKTILKAKIWENVHTVLDSAADYPNRMCTIINNVNDSKNHSGCETVMQQMTFDIARLNECELRQIQQLIKQREREYESRDHRMAEEIGERNDNSAICDKNEVSASNPQPMLLPIIVKQEASLAIE